MWHRMCRSEKRWSTCRRGEKELGDLLYLRDSKRERERERERETENDRMREIIKTFREVENIDMQG